MKKQNKGLTGLETAIILIAFVIVASAFSFAVLNLGLFTTQKTGEVMQAGLEETLSSIETAGAVVAKSSNGSITEIVIYIKSSVGKGEVDVRSGKLVITYRDKAIFRENIYPNNSTITTVYQVTGDGDTVLEYGEVFAVKIDVTAISGASLAPNDVFSIEIKPPQGSLLKVERRLPPSFDPVMDLT
ncbi:MAG: archaellin/type IV pilin N-terminal domain-containing protein [Candidatus Caldarchaeum sp.]|jgi:flagellin FlaB